MSTFFADAIADAHLLCYCYRRCIPLSLVTGVVGNIHIPCLCYTDAYPSSTAYSLVFYESGISPTPFNFYSFSRVVEKLDVFSLVLFHRRLLLRITSCIKSSIQGISFFLDGCVMSHHTRSIIHRCVNFI
jgi:hypothetical protein